MTERRKEPDPIAEAAAQPAPSDEWMTLPEAARALGRHRQTVLVMAVSGDLTIDRRAGMTFVLRASVERYLEAAQTAA